MKTISRTQDKLRQMTPEDYQQLRQAYYQAVEGLAGLVEALDAEKSLPGHLETAKTATALIDALDLGKYL